MQKIAIIIPAHNEEKRIGATLQAYVTYFNTLRKDKTIDYELLVVINNTRDNTEQIIQQIQKKNKTIRYLNLKPGGKGFAVIEGFKDALQRGNDLIGFVDADMATSPEEFHKLIEVLDSCDGAIADRYMRGSLVFPPVTFRRLFVGRFFNYLVRGLFFIPFRDTQCGAKIFKRGVIQSVIPSLSMSQWAFDVELLYNLRKQGYAIKSVPTVWIDKEYSKINFWKAGPLMALGILRLRIFNSPGRRLIDVYNNIIGFFPKS